MDPNQFATIDKRLELIEYRLTEIVADLDGLGQRVERVDDQGTREMKAYVSRALSVMRREVSARDAEHRRARLAIWCALIPSTAAVAIALLERALG